MSFTRLAALGGFVFVAMLIVAQILFGNQPLASDTVDEMARYLADDEGLHKAGTLITALSIVPALVFFAGVVGRHRASDREHGDEWSTVILLSAVILAAASGVGDAIFAGLIIEGPAELDAAVVRGLWNLLTVAYATGLVAAAGIGIGIAWPAWKHGTGPKWYMWLTAAFTVLALLASIAVTSVDLAIFGWIAFLAFAIWLLATSVLMFREA